MNLNPRINILAFDILWYYMTCEYMNLILINVYFKTCSNTKYKVILIFRKINLCHIFINEILFKQFFFKGKI